MVYQSGVDINAKAQKKEIGDLYLGIYMEIVDHMEKIKIQNATWETNRLRSSLDAHLFR